MSKRIPRAVEVKSFAVESPRWRRAFIGSALLAVLAHGECNALPGQSDPGIRAGGGVKPVLTKTCTAGAACDHPVGTSFAGNRCTVSFQNGITFVSKGQVASWTLDTTLQPVVFVERIGISIDDGTPDFVDPQRDSTGTVFSWTANDQASTRKQHKYSIHVMWMKPGTDGIACQVLDPIIVNSF